MRALPRLRRRRCGGGCRGGSTRCCWRRELLELPGTRQLDPPPRHGAYLPPQGITGTVEMLFIGAPSISLRLIAR